MGYAGGVLADTTFISTTTAWSDCSRDRGYGTRQRFVSCFNNDTKVMADDPYKYLQDQTQIRPADTRQCVGDCIRCFHHAALSKSAGLAPPPISAVLASRGNIYKVADPKWSCCDDTVEGSMLTQSAATQKASKQSTKFLRRKKPNR
jgi:hypothetical protein